MIHLEIVAITLLYTMCCVLYVLVYPSECYSAILIPIPQFVLITSHYGLCSEGIADGNYSSHRLSPPPVFG